MVTRGYKLLRLYYCEMFHNLMDLACEKFHKSIAGELLVKLFTNLWMHNFVEHFTILRYGGGGGGGWAEID